jgi:hypothetical protein
MEAKQALIFRHLIHKFSAFTCFSCVPTIVHGFLKEELALQIQPTPLPYTVEEPGEQHEGT